MIKWENTNHVYSQERLVLSTDLALVSEGQALVGCIEGGIPKVKRATGSTSEKLVGIAMTPRRTFSTNAKTENLVGPAGGGTVLLSKTVLGAIGVFRIDTYAQIASSASAASTTNVQTSTDATTGLTALTFDASFAGVAFQVNYLYTMNTSEEQGSYGNPYPGAAPSDLLGQIGVFRIGRIAVNNFDPTANWYSSGEGYGGVKVLAGGIFSNVDNSAAGFVPVNVEVEAFPTSGSPWLSLNIR